MHLTCLASSDDRHLGVANDHLLLQGEPGIRLERVVADTPALFRRSFGVRQHRSRLRSIHSASALVVTQARRARVGTKSDRLRRNAQRFIRRLWERLRFA